MERRATFSGGSVRWQKRASDGGPVISGYGAVFYDPSDPGTVYELMPDVVERFMPGAFDRALREDDVRSFFNHDPNIVLGRNTAGTLKLKVDRRGLFYEAGVSDTLLIREQVLTPIDRGEVTGSSIMFVPLKTKWGEESNGSGGTIYVREVHEVQLWEVGPVSFPAYEGTTTGLREADLEAVRKSRDEWRYERVPSFVESPRSQEDEYDRYQRLARARRVQADAVHSRADAVASDERQRQEAEAVAVKARFVEVMEREHARRHN